MAGRLDGTVDWRPKAGEMPVSPGVYRFRDPRGRVLYVGKAKNLRARLSNYFQPLRSLHERTRRMVTTAASVEWTVVGTEFEALQLEYSWIKEFSPPFNVQFRDDKSYPYLAITLGDEVPRVLITRNRKLKGAKYFGPYTKVWAIRETLDLMLKVFPARSCSDATYRRAELTGRPCLLGYIGKCSAPCVGKISPEDHRALAQDFGDFMAGNTQRFVRRIEQEMRRSLADGGAFEVHLQPLVMVDDDHGLLGAEALVRWHHPRRGVVPPAEVVPVAEASQDGLTLTFPFRTRTAAAACPPISGASTVTSAASEFAHSRDDWADRQTRPPPGGGVGRRR